MASLIFNFLLLNLFTIINSLLNLKYPTAIKLNNGKLLVISQNSIVITDSLYSEVLTYSYYFTSEEKIYDINDLSKVSISQFNDGYIIAVVINKTYVFNSEGVYQNKYTLNETEVENIEELDDIYYNLEPKEQRNNCYYYLIGTIYHNTLFLSYYKYDSIHKVFTREANDFFNYQHFDTDYAILNDGLSCNFMYYNETDILLCMYHTLEIEEQSNQYFTSGFFDIGEDGIGYYELNGHYKWYNNRVIKSVNTPNDTSALFCLIDRTGFSIYFEYNIDYLDTISIGVLGENCTYNYSSLKLYYFEEKEEYIISCITREGGIQIVNLGKELKNIADYKQKVYILDKCEIYGYSILYSSETNNYYCFQTNSPTKI